MKYVPILLLIATCTHVQTGKRYNRKHWYHWADHNRNCLNTRNEILKERSLVPVKTTKKGCKVLKGKWEDYYYPEYHDSPKKVDIDHLVPLKNAHDSGGENWSLDQKERFANDSDNLVITNLKYNRKKGSKGIDLWLPVHPQYACKYMRDWIKIKKKYDLKLLAGEESTIRQSECLK